MNSSIKTSISLALLICVAVFLSWTLHRSLGRQDDALNFTEFVRQVDDDNVKFVAIDGTTVKGEYRNKPNASFHTRIPANYPDLYKRMEEKKIAVEMKESNSAGWVGWLVNITPFILLIAFWLLFGVALYFAWSRRTRVRRG
jgi:cell division protease FtsH